MSPAGAAAAETEPSTGTTASVGTADRTSPDAATLEARARTGRRRRRQWAHVLIWYLIMVYVLITVNFLLPRAMPGNPIEGLVGQGSANFTFGNGTKLALEKYYGLHGSLLSQYAHYLNQLVHGNLGRSVVTNASVWHEMSYRIPWTLLLVASSITISLAIGMALGVHAGWHRDRPADRALTTGLITVWQFPPYVLGTILLFLFAVKVAWFPLAGAQTPFSRYSLPERVLDIAKHLALPLFVLVASLTAWNYLLMRAGMVSELGSDYLMLGRAKGLRERRLKYRYAARNALLPLVSSTAVDIGFAVAANIVIERVFSYPGLGGLLFDSVGTRDYPVIQGVFLLLGFGILTVNALADLLYARLDPRTVAT